MDGWTYGCMDGCTSAHYIYICVCVCVHAQADKQTNKRTYVRTYIHTYIHIWGGLVIGEGITQVSTKGSEDSDADTRKPKKGKTAVTGSNPR